MYIYIIFICFYIFHEDMKKTKNMILDCGRWNRFFHLASSLVIFPGKSPEIEML